MKVLLFLFKNGLLTAVFAFVLTSNTYFVASYKPLTYNLIFIFISTWIVYFLDHKNFDQIKNRKNHFLQRSTVFLIIIQGGLFSFFIIHSKFNVLVISYLFLAGLFTLIHWFIELNSVLRSLFVALAWVLMTHLMPFSLMNIDPLETNFFIYVVFYFFLYFINTYSVHCTKETRDRLDCFFFPVSLIFIILMPLAFFTTGISSLLSLFALNRCWKKNLHLSYDLVILAPNFALALIQLVLR